MLERNLILIYITDDIDNNVAVAEIESKLDIRKKSYDLDLIQIYILSGTYKV